MNALEHNFSEALYGERRHEDRRQVDVPVAVERRKSERRRAGRKTRVDGARSARRRFIRLTDAEDRALQALADENSETVTALIRNAIDAYVSDYTERPLPFRRTAAR